MMWQDERREGVRRAAQLMDRVRPGWFRRIVFKRLDMQSACDCIGGQAGLDWRELQDEFERENPDLMMACPFADEDAREPWIDEVRDRRGAA